MAKWICPSLLVLAFFAPSCAPLPPRFDPVPVPSWWPVPPPPAPATITVVLDPNWLDDIKWALGIPPIPCTRTPAELSALNTAFNAGLVLDLDLNPPYQFRGYFPGGMGSDFTPLEFTLKNTGTVALDIQEILGGIRSPPLNCPPSEADFDGTGFPVPEIELLPGATPITLPATIGPDESWRITMNYPASHTFDGRLHVNAMNGQTMAWTAFRLKTF